MSPATRKHSPCPACFSPKTSRSRRQGVERLTRFLPLRPYRCRHCKKRFWKLSGKPRDWIPVVLGVFVLGVVIAVLWATRHG